MRHPIASLALAALLLAVPGAAAADAFADLVKDFPPRVSDRGDAAPRAALVDRVAGFDNPDGARLLLAGLAALVERLDKDLAAYEVLHKKYEAVNTTVDVKKDNYRTRTELQNLLMSEDARQREDEKVLDEFRKAIPKFQDARTISALSTEVRKLRSWRSREVVGEGLAGSAAGTESSIKLAKDPPDERVAAAVLRGLRGRTEDAIFDYAKDCLKAESWPVRLEAVLTLEKVNQPRVIPPLIEDMAREEGRLRDDVRDALRRLTSQNYDADPEQWRMWWVDNKDKLEGLGPKTALFGAFTGKNPPPAKKSVYGIESRSRHILFIIDVSGSMKEKITQQKGTPTGKSPEELEELDMTKIEMAKHELKRAIHAIEPDAWFDIISFSTTVARWKEKMVRGDMTTKNEALSFVNDLEAVGCTWAYGAFQEAFRLAGMGALDKNYDPSVDTIYFISDGAPTDNDMDHPALQDLEIVLAAVRDWNRLGKLAIHTIAVDPRAGGGKFIDFMKKLAAQNNGQYTERK